MIQRLQSLYLTLVLLLSLLFLSGSALTFVDDSGNAVKLMVNGNLTSQSDQAIGQIANMWPLTAILIMISLWSLIAIFLFKNRKIQLIVAIGVIVMSAGLLIGLSWYGSNVISNFNLKITPGIKMSVPLLILIFSVLAFRGILKDDRLVKSYDRLR
jgi:hypothetical protein